MSKLVGNSNAGLIQVMLLNYPNYIEDLQNSRCYALHGLINYMSRNLIRLAMYLDFN